MCLLTDHSKFLKHSEEMNYSIAENDSVLLEDCLDYVSYKKRLRLLQVAKVQIDSGEINR